MQKTEKELQNDLIEAKKSGDIEAMREAIIELLRPEAREAIRLSEKDITHKNGYTVIMRTATQCGQYKNLFLKACEREGYDVETLRTLRELV